MSLSDLCLVFLLFSQDGWVLSGIRARVEGLLQIKGHHDVGLLLLEYIVEGVGLGTLGGGLGDGLDRESLPAELAGLRGIRELGQVEPRSAIHWLHLLSGTAGLGTWLASWRLASLGCCVLLRRRQLVEVKPDTLVVCDLLLQLLDVSSTKCSLGCSVHAILGGSGIP